MRPINLAMFDPDANLHETRKMRAGREPGAVRMPLAFPERLLGTRMTMGGNAVGAISLNAALRLGRISNLPTVWTNVTAGIVLSGAAFAVGPSLLLMLSLSLFYVAGMFLNDAFDREFDRRDRPQRPIPAGEVAAATVFACGFGLLVAGFALLVFVGYATAEGTGWRAPAAGAVLAALIILYDAWHKANPVGPLLMGFCRLLVYVVTGLAVVGTIPPGLVLAALVCLCYLIGLTYVAKQESLRRIENFWPLLFLAVPFVYGAPFAVQGGIALVLYLLLLATVGAALVLIFRPGHTDIPHAIMLLIAGISLLDGMFMAGQGKAILAVAAVAAFLFTLFLQRFVPGT
jgi:4-hydroxybenzoate polyprenyltransferase